MSTAIPGPGAEQSSPLWTFLSFLNCTKYPASLLYLLMTLGPAILALAVFDRPLGPLARPVDHFRPGAALLLPAAHSAHPRRGGAPRLSAIRLVAAGHRGSLGRQTRSDPRIYGVSLPVVYLIWIGVVLVLYLPCRWFAGVKQRRRDVWLSYL